MPNAASVKSIPQITISNRAGVTFDAGKFDNAYIKALNLDIGLIDNPTSINIGLIEEQGNYRDYPLTYLDEYNLRIGSDLSIWCYLIGQKKSTSSDGKTSEVEFVDGSHILDRVFVGGVGVHTNHTDFFNINYVDDVSIPVACPPCYTNQIISVPDPNAVEIVNAVTAGRQQFPNDIGVNPIYTARNLKNSLKRGIGGNRDGGYIFLGDEKFTKTSCELADVDYTFQDLIDGCSNFGIDILIPDKSRPPNGEKSTLRKSHWGTLRSVLKSWCADFGTSFTYDYTQLVPTILEVPLGIPTRSATIQDIAAIAKLINSRTHNVNTTRGVVTVTNNDGNTLVEKVDENRTLRGSLKNNVITSYKRGRVKRNFTKNTYYRTGYRCFQTSDVLGLEARSYRTAYQFNQCAYLAKYDQSIRTLFLTWLAGQRYNGGQGDGLMYRALGFNVTATLDRNLQQEIIDECLNTETYREITSYFTVPGQIEDFDMLLGNYSEEVADKHAEFEKSFAEDFLGKYYFTNLQSFADSKYGGYKECFTGADWRYEIESSLTPEPKEIATNINTVGNATSLQARLFNQSKLPFAKHLWGPIPLNPFSFYDWFSDARGKIFNRTEAPWSIPQEFAENIFKQKTNEGIVDLAQPFLPRFQPIAGVIETRLRARFKGTNIPVAQVIDGIKQKSVPCLLIAPKPARIGQILDVGDLVDGINDNETPFYFNKGSSMGNKLDCGESLACEIQEGLDKKICDPKIRCADYPKTPPASLTLSSAVGKIVAAQDDEPFAEGVINQIGGRIDIIFAPPTLDQIKKGGQSAIFGPARTLSIVGPAGTGFNPVNDLYLANYKESIKSDYYTPKIEKFLGDDNLTPPLNVSEVKLTLNNVASNDPVFSAKDPITNQVTVITKIYIEGYGFLTLEDYHKMVTDLSNQEMADPFKHDVTVDFGSLNFGALSRYLNAQSGLNKLSCNIDAGGISASAGWSNRPATPPTQDLFTAEIQPQILSRKSNFNE